MSKILQLDSTNLVLLKYEKNNGFFIFLPVASKYMAKNGAKIYTKLF